MESIKNRFITCKAAVCWGQRQPLVIEEIQVEPPNYMEVRIKIIQTSFCHSDLYNWKGPARIPETYLRILGHEGVRIVIQQGMIMRKNLKMDSHQNILKRMKLRAATIAA